MSDSSARGEEATQEQWFTSLWACSSPSAKLWEDQRSDFELAGEEKTTEGIAEKNRMLKPIGVVQGAGLGNKRPRVMVNSQKVVDDKLDTSSVDLSGKTE